MQQNGYKQIQTVACVLCLCGLIATPGHTWRLEVIQDDHLTQNNGDLMQKPRARPSTQQLLASFLHLKGSHNTGRKEEEIESVLGGSDPFQLNPKPASNEQEESDSDDQTLPEKRQRPCFWSVVTCY